MDARPSIAIGFRAEFILLRLDGMKIEDVAAHMNTSMRGRKPSSPEAKVARVITEATRPPNGRSVEPQYHLLGTARANVL